jgi:hypothetical protein
MKKTSPKKSATSTRAATAKALDHIELVAAINRGEDPRDPVIRRRQLDKKVRNFKNYRTQS